jgi:hypothetical protein
VWEWNKLPTGTSFFYIPRILAKTFVQQQPQFIALSLNNFFQFIILGAPGMNLFAFIPLIHHKMCSSQKLFAPLSRGFAAFIRAAFVYHIAYHTLCIRETTVNCALARSGG